MKKLPLTDLQKLAFRGAVEHAGMLNILAQQHHTQFLELDKAARAAAEARDNALDKIRTQQDQLIEAICLELGEPAEGAKIMDGPDGLEVCWPE